MKKYLILFCFWSLLQLNGYAQNYIGLTLNELRDEIEQNDDVAYWSLIPEKKDAKEHVIIRNKDGDDMHEYYFSKGVVNRYVIVSNITRHYLYVKWLNKEFESKDFNAWSDYKQQCKWTTEISGDILKIIATPAPDLKKERKFLSFRK